LGLDERSKIRGEKENMKRSIPVAAPALIGNEKKYVQDCLDTSWISSCGKYIDLFEEQFARFCNSGHAIACSNGTVALHLALKALDVGPGDEVIVPTLTFVATANAVTYCGATPVFADSEPLTWNMDPSLIEPLITPRTKGIIAVHLYGHPVDMDPILEVARAHSLFVIEDAAEAHGADYKGRRVGSLGNIATFSFYGNKILTTGEGGMAVTGDSVLAQKIRLLKGQGMDPDRRYWFPMVGYNYRMTNIAAAIGLAQLEKADWHINRRREIAELYKKFLENIPAITMQPELSWARCVYWMTSIVLDQDLSLSRDEVMRYLAEEGIETRPFFYPMHSLPMYQSVSDEKTYPVADRLSAQGINLPSFAQLSPEDIEYVCDRLTRIISRR
jgi:perosamine synthetase